MTLLWHSWPRYSEHYVMRGTGGSTLRGCGQNRVLASPLLASFSPLASIPRVSVRALVPHPLWCRQVSSSLLDFQRAERRKGPSYQPFGGFHTTHSGCIVSSLEWTMHIATQTHYFCHRIKHGYQVKNRTEWISNFSIRKWWALFIFLFSEKLSLSLLIH